MQGRWGARRRLARSAVAVAALGLATAAAQAGTLTISDGVGSGSGGEFAISNLVLGSGEYVSTLNGTNVQYPYGLGSSFEGQTYGSAQFETFCVERNEYISLPGNYSFTVSTGAINGGVGGQSSTNFDPVSAETAYLYREFRAGTLWVDRNGNGTQDATDLYNYTGVTGTGYASRTTWANSLQDAIWYLENELTTAPGSGSLAGRLVTAAQNWVTANGDNLRGVRIMNLTQNGVLKQSQLALVPLPTSAYAGLGLLAGLGIFGVIRRRNRSALA